MPKKTNYLSFIADNPDNKREGYYRCACGETVVYEKSRVKRNKITSCGCDSSRPMNTGRASDPLYNIFYRYKYKKKWASFYDFKAELGTPPVGVRRSYVLPKVPGTEVGPGNVRWGVPEEYMFDLSYEAITMHHKKFLEETKLNDVDKELFALEESDPDSWQHCLAHIRHEFNALRKDDTYDWQLAIEQQAKDYATTERRRQEDSNFNKKRASQTQVGRLFRYQLCNCLADILEDWHTKAGEMGCGHHFKIIEPLLQRGNLDFMTIAHITLTVVFDKLGRNAAFQTTIGKIKVEIGEKIDHQAFLNNVAEKFPRDYDKIDRWYLRNGEMGYEYKINNSKQIVSEQYTYPFLTTKEAVAVGDWSFTVFSNLTRWFENEKVWNFGAAGFTNYLKLSEEGIKHRALLQAAADAAEYCAWAMVHEPLDWSADQRGGYLKHHPGSYHELIHNDHGTIPSESAFAAINKQQKVPFKLNKFIYHIQEHLLKDTNEIGAFVSYEAESWVDENFPRIDPNIWDLPTDDPEYKKAKRTLKYAYRSQKKAEKLAKNPYRVLKTAARFYDVDRFYFSCFFDSRLRIYTHAVGLTYQGADYQKALLLFADGVEVTDANREQVRKEMMVSIANTYGNDKISFDERIQFAEDLVKDIECVAKDPLSTAARNIWADSADEPFQFLALVREFYELFVWKTKTVTEVAGGRDATNSGNQILGGMCKDSKTCYYTNVITDWEGKTADKPQDLYGVVANKVNIYLQSDVFVERKLEQYRKSAQKKAKKEGIVLDPDALEFTINPRLGSYINRKHVKRACMIDAYGGSWRSKNDHISDEMNTTAEKNQIKFTLAEKRLITDCTVKAQASEFPLSDQLNNWFKSVGKAAVKQGLKLIEWKTPDGSLCIQEYLEPDIITVDTYAMGGGTYYRPLETDGKGNNASKAKRSSVNIRNGWKDEVMEGKMQTALGANFTHSHDAFIIRDVMNAIDTPFFGIHDCIYTPHGSLQETCRLMRDSYYRCVTSDCLNKLVTYNNLEVDDHPLGNADISVCHNSPYMFS